MPGAGLDGRFGRAADGLLADAGAPQSDTRRQRSWERTISGYRCKSLSRRLYRERKMRVLAP